MRAQYDPDTNDLIGYYPDEWHEELTGPVLFITEEEWHAAVEEEANAIDPTKNKLVREDKSKSKSLSETTTFVQEEAIEYLDSTLYYLIREIELGEPIPAEVKQNRLKCYDIIGTKVVGTSTDFINSYEDILRGKIR